MNCMETDKENLKTHHLARLGRKGLRQTGKRPGKRSLPPKQIAGRHSYHEAFCWLRYKDKQTYLVVLTPFSEVLLYENYKLIEVRGV